MERMFSPWRMEYVRGGGSGGPRCIFCLGEEDRRDPERLVLGIYPNTLAICNRYPYNNGHVLVAPRRHVDDLTLLSGEERRELISLVALGSKALAEEYSPEGLNVGRNLGKGAGAGLSAHPRCGRTWRSSPGTGTASSSSAWAISTRCSSRTPSGPLACSTSRSPPATRRRTSRW